jgi:hypothetical protein
MEQDDVPSGAMRIGAMGAIEGGAIPHIPMHSGRMSIELEQMACICPLTHWQEHPADAGAVMA